MSNQTVRRLIGGLGTALILIICGVFIGAYFLTERNIQRISIPKYVDVSGDSDGYAFTLDVDRLLFEEHLVVPPDSELDRYPEIAALKTLGVRATERNGAYELETISTSTDPHFNETLKAGGIKLADTQWTWTREQIAAKLGEHRDAVKQLRYSEYICTSREADGSFRAELDLVRLMRDAGVSRNANPETNAGARALRSLGIACSKTDGVYLLQATSMLSTINEDLAAAGLQIVGTSWNWTEDEMAQHIGAVETLAPAATEPNTPEAPAETPDESSAVTPPEVHETPEPTPAPTEPAKSLNAIDSLFDFDQTEVRKAIRAAKEAKYGSSFESSEVKYNYFAVGGENTAHGNVFRLVYQITTSKGKEYLIADVYDLESETGYRASDVQLTATSDSKTAKSTDDLKEYTVYTLEGGSMVFPENNGESPFDSQGLVMAKSLSEKLSYEELWDIPQTKDLTLYQLLGYARNEMFARGGHKFKDTSTYYKYFKQYSWYKPTGEVTANQLAAMYPATKDNIATIKFLEKLIKEG